MFDMTQSTEQACCYPPAQSMAWAQSTWAVYRRSHLTGELICINHISAAVPQPRQLTTRERFEAYWIETRGAGRARDPLDPQVYASDEANRHWVTYQEALKWVSR